MRKQLFALMIASFSSTVAADSLIPFVSGSMAEIKSSQKEKPLIVNFWSIDCPPCYKELSMWRELGKQYPDMNLVLVSTDTLDVADDVAQVLKAQGVERFPSWQFSETHVQRLRYEIDKLWYGELPRTYFYSPSGESLAISGVVEHDKVEKWLAQYYLTTK